MGASKIKAIKIKQAGCKDRKRHPDREKTASSLVIRKHRDASYNGTWTLRKKYVDATVSKRDRSHAWFGIMEACRPMTEVGIIEADQCVFYEFQKGDKRVLLKVGRFGT